MESRPCPSLGQHSRVGPGGEGASAPHYIGVLHLPLRHSALRWCRLRGDSLPHLPLATWGSWEIWPQDYESRGAGLAPHLGSRVEMAFKAEAQVSCPVIMDEGELAPPLVCSEVQRVEVMLSAP